MTTNIGGRPRNPDVPTEPGTCPTHGIVEFRLHKSRVRKDGTQAYLRRCPACHSIANGGSGEGIPVD